MDFYGDGKAQSLSQNQWQAGAAFFAFFPRYAAEGNREVFAAQKLPVLPREFACGGKAVLSTELPLWRA